MVISILRTTEKREIKVRWSHITYVWFDAMICGANRSTQPVIASCKTFQQTEATR